MLEVHLMDDPDAGRHHTEGFKSLLTPFEEFVALAVTLKLILQVRGKGQIASGSVHLNRMVNHQINRHERLDLFRVATLLLHGIPHCSEVHQQGHTREILQYDPGHHKRDFHRLWLPCVPVCQGLHIPLTDLAAIAIAQHRLQHDPDTHRQTRDRAHTLFLQLRQRIIAAETGSIRTRQRT